MLKIYNVSYEYKIEGKNWVECGYTKWNIGEESKIPNVILEVDNVCVDQLWYKMRKCGNPYEGLRAASTPIFKRKYIEVNIKDFPNRRIKKLFMNNTKMISYRVLYKERTHVTCEWILKHLHIDDAIRYFREHGVFIPSLAS